MSQERNQATAGGAVRHRDAVTAARRFLDARLAVAARERRRYGDLPTHDLTAFLDATQLRRLDLVQLLKIDRCPLPVGVTAPRRRQLAPQVEGLTWPTWDGFTADGLVARLDSSPRPTVLLLHPLTGSPEAVLAPGQQSPLAAIARALVGAGCQVVVPRWINDWRERQRLARQARLLGLEWLGLELLTLRRLVDALFAEGSIDDERLGVYGFSRGGQLALLLAAVDARACATAVGSWFCQRIAKLLDTNDQRLACYLDSPEDEQFVPGWLTCLTDAELAALGAPEPLLVTHGLDDPVTPYEHVEAAFGPVAALYDALGFGHLARLHLQPGGHVPAVAATLAFFAEWLALPALDLPAPRPATPSRTAPRLSVAAASRRRRARRTGSRR